MIAGVTPGWLRARGAAARMRAAIEHDQTTAARILNVTVEQYLNDPCKTPSLNAGTAHALVAKSPLHAWTQHPRLGGNPNGTAPGTKAMADGELIHKLVLGAGKDVALIDAPDFRTNAARDARDAAYRAGKIPMLQHVFAEKAAIAARLRDQCAALGYPFDGRSEVVVEWTDEGVLCRSMFDHALIERAQVFDVKKVENANPRQIARTFVEYGYDIQYAAYTRAMAKLEPEFEGRIDFTFLFMEIEPPYSVVPVKPDGSLREIGALRWDKGRELWRKCLASNNWPGYSDGEPINLEAPQWVVIQELGTWQA